MICKLEANIAVEAAHDRINGVSLLASTALVNKKLSALGDPDSDLIIGITKVMKAKVSDVYLLYSLNLIQKPNFRSYMHGLCLSELVPPSDPSLPVDYRFIQRTSVTFKLALAGSVPEELVDKVSQAAAICMFTEYRSESHKAIDEFITYIADGKTNSDAQKLIMLSYIDDDEAINAFTRVATSSRACLENAYRSMVKKK
jgi:hypothetical protein